MKNVNNKDDIKDPGIVSHKDSRVCFKMSLKPEKFTSLKLYLRRMVIRVPRGGPPQSPGLTSRHSLLSTQSHIFLTINLQNSTRINLSISRTLSSSSSIILTISAATPIYFDVIGLRTVSFIGRANQAT